MSSRLYGRHATILGIQPGGAGAPGPGFEPGGVQGQVIIKASNADYDTEWVDYVPVGGPTGQFLTKASGNDYDMEWSDSPIDFNLYGRRGGLWEAAVPILGGAMTGPLILSEDPTPAAGMQAVTERYAVPRAGGTMSGELLLDYPTSMHPFSAVTRQTLEMAIAAASLYQGTWQVAANIPDLVNPIPPGNSYSWIAVTVDSEVAEMAPPGMAGLGGQMIHNGSTIIWNETLRIFQEVPGSSISRTQADSLYVALAGSIMTGDLILNVNPTLPMQAATKHYADVLHGGGPSGPFVPIAGGNMTGPLGINNATTNCALTILNGPGLGAVQITDQSNAHSVTITNTGGGAALIINDDTNSTAVQITNNGGGTGLMLNQAEGLLSAALTLNGGNRNSAGVGLTSNTQIALTTPGGGRPQWITSWTDVGGGSGVGGESIGFFTNDHNGGSWPVNAEFCGSFNRGRFVAPFGAAATPSIVFGNGPNTSGFTIDNSGFFRPAINEIGVAINGGQLCRFDFAGFWMDHMNTGYWLHNNGGIWGRSNGVTIRCGTGNQQPQIENSNGLGGRDIIDTVNGDARYVNKTGDSMNGQLSISRPAGNIGLSLDDGYLRLYKSNTTVSTAWPDIRFAVPIGRDASGNGVIRLLQTGPYQYYGTQADFEFYVTRQGWGTQRAFWTRTSGGGWCDLAAQGNVYANGVILTSDFSLKEDIEPIDPQHASEVLSKVQAVTYKWKPLEVDVPLAAPGGKMPGPRAEEQRRQYGLVADDLEQIMPEAVFTRDDGKKAYDIGAVFAVVVSELQRQQKSIASLSALLASSLSALEKKE